MSASIINNLDGAEIHGDKKASGISEQRCRVCNIPSMCKTNFFDHLTGKRHIKNRKFQKDTPQSVEKTLCVRGLPPGSFLEVFDCFWPYGLTDAAEVDTHIFIEFGTVREAQAAAQDIHVINGQKLDVSFKNAINNMVTAKMTKDKSKGSTSLMTEADLIPISPRLAELMQKIVDEESIDYIVQQLIDEIELKQRDGQKRYKVRSVLEKFLQQMFPSARTFIFGSSINSLGFTGCDIDMYADLGVNPWAYGTKQQMEQRAAKLTHDIAREIRKRRRGYDVIPIARARVPIVKFKEYSTGIDVDLSFRSPMPIYNTSLIKLYTRVHGIVRPYLMLLRYWGKLQAIVGGGKPSTLLTNYCYAMMMLFWIMHRNSPIIPSVSELKCKLYFENPLMYISGGANVVNGWDCSFSENVHEWTNLHHETTIISLAEEFFEFYGKFDASMWVICPLIGQLLSKRDLGNQNRSNLPSILHPYCNVARFQSDTPFCVQDPFEHNHNIARGLSEYSLALFQYKCKQAAEICKLIKQKKAPLSLLFKPIKVVVADLKQVNKCIPLDKNDGLKNNEPVDLVDENIAVLFESNDESKEFEDSACCSSNKENQREGDAVGNTHSSPNPISVKNQGLETKNNSESINECFSDVEIIQDCPKVFKRVEVVTLDSTSTDSLDNESDIERSEFIVIDEDNEDSNKECIVSEKMEEKSSKVPVPLLKAKEINIKDSIACSSVESANSDILTSSVLENLKCDFSFNERQEFSIDKNGNINVLEGIMTSHLRETKVLELIKFVLSSCLMCSVEDCLEINDCENSLKRKSFSKDDPKSLRGDSSKLFKNMSGGSLKVHSEYTHLFRIKCTHLQYPWVQRRIVAKKLFRGKNSLLNYEKTLSDKLVTKRNHEKITNMVSYIDISKKSSKPCHFCVTIKENTIMPKLRSENTSVSNLLKQFFELFSRIVKDAFVDTSRYIQLGS